MRTRATRAASAAAILAALWTCATLVSCRAPEPRHREVLGPTLVVLGTAQDGGVPHASCGCVRCEHARRGDPNARRLVASLALVFPDSGSVYLVDATPDLPEQLERARAVLESSGAARPRAGVDRAPLEGIFLTHAHMGHYLGLAHLGFEAVHVRDLAVFATERMRTFLATNGPWSQLVLLGEIALRPLAPEVPVELEGHVSVTAFRVPHRDELSDTVGFRIVGPRHTFLYVPDTDDWELWSPPLAERLAEVDFAFLDGTFYSLDELPGRSLEEVRHPLMRETMELCERLRAGDASSHPAVFFTHLNHTNRTLGPELDARAELERRGFRVLEEGATFEL